MCSSDLKAASFDWRMNYGTAAAVVFFYAYVAEINIEGVIEPEKEDSLLGVMQSYKHNFVTSKVGTRMEIPVNLPFNDGMTFPTALAAPVEDGMMLPEAARPPLQSFIEGPSTVFWVAVVEWTVVIKPSLIPNLSRGKTWMEEYWDIQ